MSLTPPTHSLNVKKRLIHQLQVHLIQLYQEEGEHQTLSDWIEEAIREKLGRESAQRNQKNTQK